MKVDFQVTFTAKCDIEDAFNDYQTITQYADPADPDRAIYEAIEENLYCPIEAVEHLPQSVIEDFAKVLRTRIGGIQMEMELD